MSSRGVVSLWTVFELTNDARTRKIRAGSDFGVIRTSTRTYVRTDVRTIQRIFFPHCSLVWGSLTLAPITADLRDNADIQAKSTDFIRKANSILVRFGTCNPYVLCYLIRSYCTSFYGCSTWSLVSQSSLYQLQVHMNKICRRIWHLVRHTHSNYCHLLSGLQSITNLVYGGCNKFLQLYVLKIALYVWFILLL